MKNCNKYGDIEYLYKIILTISPSHRNKSIVSNGKETIEEIQLNVEIFVEELINSISKWIEKKSIKEYKLNFTIETDFWNSTSLDGATGFQNIY